MRNHDAPPPRPVRAARRGGSLTLSSRVTMFVTWTLSARPLPVTAALTSLGVCRATGSPRRAAQAIAIAPACAVPITVRTFCWLNTRSTATASGRHSSSQASISVSIASSRTAMSSPADVLMTPTRTMVSARPGAPSTTPTPHLVSPGSTPSTRIGCRAYDKPPRRSPSASAGPGPRTSFRVELTGPRAVRSATPAACPSKGVEHVGRGGEGGVQRRVVVRPPAVGQARLAQRDERGPGVQRGQPARAQRDGAVSQADGAAGTGRASWGVRAQRVEPARAPGHAQLPAAGVNGTGVVGDAQRDAERGRGGEPAGGDGRGSVDHPEHPPGPLRYVGVALPGEPPERAGGPGYGVDPVGDRGVRAELRPERPHGLAGHRLGSLHEQLLVPALPPVGEEAVLGQVGVQARVGQPVRRGVRIPGDRAA